MPKHTLSEIEKFAQENYPEWDRVIDEEPTLFKDFKNNHGENVVVVVTEDGTSVGTNEKNHTFTSKKKWNKVHTTYLYKYDPISKEYTSNEEVAKNFDEITLLIILHVTMEWINFIE